jgi:hypothetical protein
MNINALIERHYWGETDRDNARQFAIELLEMVKSEGERTESGPGLTVLFAQHDAIDKALGELRK